MTLSLSQYPGPGPSGEYAYTLAAVDWAIGQLGLVSGDASARTLLDAFPGPADPGSLSFPLLRARWAVGQLSLRAGYANPFTLLASFQGPSSPGELRFFSEQMAYCIDTLGQMLGEVTPPPEPVEVLWTPEYLDPLLTAEMVGFDPIDPANYTTSGGYVETMVNLGNGGGALTASGVERPALTTINGVPALEDGADWAVLRQGSRVHPTAPITIFMVLDGTETPTITSQNVDQPTTGYYFQTSGGNVGLAGSGWDGSAPPHAVWTAPGFASTGGPHVLAVTVGADLALMKQDGNVVTLGANLLGGDAAGITTILRMGFFPGMKVGRTYWMRGVPVSADWDRLEGYLAHLYNITTLRADHPYKDAAPTIFIEADLTAPVLSSPLDASSGSTTAALSVSTNENTGVLYLYVSTSPVAPSAANLKSGAGSVRYSAQAVSVVGTQFATITGLSPSTAYYAHFLHRDLAGNDSAIVSGDGFTTDANTGHTYHVTTANWYSILTGTAVGGDTVKLASGTYSASGDLETWAIVKTSPGVTIMPDDGATVNVRTIHATDSQWLIFDGFTCQPTAGDGGVGDAGLTTNPASHNITFRNITVHRSDGVSTEGLGANLYGCTNTTVEYCTFHHLGAAIGANGTTGLIARHNTISHTGHNGIFCNLGCVNTTLTYNTMGDAADPMGDHPDWVQFGAGPRHNGVFISQNTLFLGTGFASQGLFLIDIDNAVVTRNVITCTEDFPEVMPTSIAVARGAHFVITENFVKNSLIYRDGTNDILISGNAVAYINNVPAGGGEAANTNDTVAGGQVILDGTSSDADGVAWRDALA